MFNKGAWNDVDDHELQDSEIRELAKSLPDVVLQGRAPSTATVVVFVGGRSGHHPSQ